MHVGLGPRKQLQARRSLHCDGGQRPWLWDSLGKVTLTSEPLSQTCHQTPTLRPGARLQPHKPRAACARLETQTGRERAHADRSVRTLLPPSAKSTNAEVPKASSATCHPRAGSALRLGDSRSCRELSPWCPDLGRAWDTPSRSPGLPADPSSVCAGSWPLRSPPLPTTTETGRAPFRGSQCHLCCPYRGDEARRQGPRATDLQARCAAPSRRGDPKNRRLADDRK